MRSLQNPPAIRRALLLNAFVPLSSQVVLSFSSPSPRHLHSVSNRRFFLAVHPPSCVLGLYQPALQGPAVFPGHRRKRRCVLSQVRAEVSTSSQQEKFGRRQIFAIGAVTSVFLSPTSAATFAAETTKGFQAVLDQKDGYSFLYPFGWQEVDIQGQDKVFKDVIEPLESVSVNMIATTKKDVRDLGSPQEVANALVRKVLAPSTQKTKVVEASELDVDGKVYYNFEFIAQAPNFTRHALGVITIGNGKFYTLTTGANERRWEKMKDKLHTVIDSFKIFTV